MPKINLLFRYGHPKFFLLILFLILAFFTIRETAFANEIVINVTGNKRTQAKYINDLVEEYLTDNNITDIADVDEKRLKEHIYNTKLFSEVAVVKEDAAINIAIKDRWTLIVVPFFSAGGDDSTRYGLFATERNFLGYGKTVSAGTIQSDDQESYFAMYLDKSVLSSNWTMMNHIKRANTDYYIYEGEDEIFGTHEKSKNLTLFVGYNFSNSFSSSPGIEGKRNRYNRLEEYSVPEDYDTLISSLHLQWDYSDYRLYFQEGIKTTLSLKYQAYRDDEVDNYYGFSAKFNWQKQLFKNNVLQALIQSAFIEEGDERDDFRVGGNGGFRGIHNKGVWTKGYLTGSLEYQIPLKFTTFGTWTVAPFCDIGYLKIRFPESASELYAAAGVGTYFYLKNIALPGAGFQVGHNTEYEDLFFKFSIGFAF